MLSTNQPGCQVTKTCCSDDKAYCKSATFACTSPSIRVIPSLHCHTYNTDQLHVICLPNVAHESFVTQGRQPDKCAEAPWLPVGSLVYTPHTFLPLLPVSLAPKRLRHKIIAQYPLCRTENYPCQNRTMFLEGKAVQPVPNLLCFMLLVNCQIPSESSSATPACKKYGH